MKRKAFFYIVIQKGLTLFVKLKVGDGQTTSISQNNLENIITSMSKSLRNDRSKVPFLKSAFLRNIRVKLNNCECSYFHDCF